MKILVIGDVHGRLEALDVIARENADKVIMLGDFVSTHDDISDAQQLSVMEDILNMKEDEPDKYILLRGNHDTQHAGYYWADCSGYFRGVASKFPKDRWLDLTQWCHVEEFDNQRVIFSHAGISATFIDRVCHKLRSMFHQNFFEIDDINKLPPSELFGFTPDSVFDRSGTSKTQPLTWIRPQSLIEDFPTPVDEKTLVQVVGHTPVQKIINTADIKPEYPNIWLCDCLPYQYLVIEDGKFNVKTI